MVCVACFVVAWGYQVPSLIGCPPGEYCTKSSRRQIDEASSQEGTADFFTLSRPPAETKIERKRESERERGRERAPLPRQRRAHSVSTFKPPVPTRADRRARPERPPLCLRAAGVPRNVRVRLRRGDDRLRAAERGAGDGRGGAGLVSFRGGDGHGHGEGGRGGLGGDAPGHP